MKTLSVTVASLLWPLCLIIFLFSLHFCILRHFKIIRCIAKSLIATSTYFLLKSNWKKENLKGVFWAPEIARPNQHTSILNDLNMWLIKCYTITIANILSFDCISCYSDCTKQYVLFCFSALTTSWSTLYLIVAVLILFNMVGSTRLYRWPNLTNCCMLTAEEKDH